MARGDFRSSTGQVISAGQRQIHNTSGTITRARDMQSRMNPLASGINRGIGLAAQILQREATKAEREAAQNARMIDKTLVETKRKETSLAQQQYFNDALTQNPEDANLSPDEFLKKHGDFPFTDYSDVSDPTLVKVSEMEERSIFNQALSQAKYSYQRAQTVNKFTTIANNSAGTGYSDYDKLMGIADEEGMSEQEVWSGLTSSALTASTQGNYKAAVSLIQRATDIKDIELRDAVVRELTPLANAAKRATDLRRTADYDRLKGIRTVEELNSAKNDLGDMFKPSQWSTVHARVDKYEARNQFEQQAIGTFQASAGNFEILQRELTETPTLKGVVTGNPIDVSLTEREIDQIVDREFNKMFILDPQRAVDSLKNSVFIPKGFKSRIGDVFSNSFLADGVDPNDIAYLDAAIQVVGGDENPLGASAELGERFGIKGKQLATAEIMFVNMALGKPLEVSLEEAAKAVNHFEQYESREPEANYQTALNEEIAEREEFTPSQRKAARETMNMVKSFVTATKAAELAIKTAEAMASDIDTGLFSSQNVVRGREFQSVLDHMLKGYTDDVDYDSAIELLLDVDDGEYDSSNVSIEFQPEVVRGSISPTESKVSIALPDRLPRVIPMSDLKEMLEEKYSDKLKVNNMDYDNEYSNIDANKIGSLLL